MLNQLDINIFNLINQFAGHNFFDDSLVTVLAEYLPFIFILLLIYLWFRKDNKIKNIILYSGYSVIFGVLLNFLITLFYFHPRPFMDDIGILLINHTPETSFPSDHTTFMLAIAFMFVCFKQTRKVGIILSMLGIIGGLARVYCGLHYPFDILGSIMVAMISSAVIFLFKDKLRTLNRFIVNLYFKT